MNSPSDAMNCREAGPGRGLCIECANGNYERCLYVVRTSKAMDIRAEIRELREFGRALPSMALLELAQRLEDIAHPENAPPHETYEPQPNIARALLAAGAGKMFAQRHCPNLVGDFSAIEDALRPSQKASEPRKWRFDRYTGRDLKAEGITVHAVTEAEAWEKAESLKRQFHSPMDSLRLTSQGKPE